MAGDSGVLLSQADVQNNLKIIQTVSNRIMFETRPLLGMIKKIDDLQGRTMEFLTAISKAGGVSASFDKAYAERATPDGNVRWVVTMSSASNSGGIAKQYAYFEINELTLRLATGGDASFYDEFQQGIISMKEKMAARLNFHLFRKANGSISTVTYSANATSFTLNTIPSGYILEVGDPIVFAADSSGAPGTLRASGAQVYVVAINRATGVVSCSSTRGGSAEDIDNTITSLTTGDHVLHVGDKDAVVSGIQDWIAGSSVAATSFFGVNRSVDGEKLAGHLLTGSVNITNSLIEASEKIEIYGARIPKIFMNPADIKTLKKELENQQVRYREVKADEGKASISYRALDFEGMDIFSDIAVPKGKAFLLDLETWELHTNGQLASPFRIDGSEQFVVDVATDGRSVRLNSVCQLICKNPSRNVIVTLP